MSAFDLNKMPHVVIVERPEGMRIVEFDRDATPSPAEAAHAYAMSLASSEFFGRIIVAMRVRQIQPLAYIQACEDAKKPDV